MAHPNQPPNQPPQYGQSGTPAPYPQQHGYYQQQPPPYYPPPPPQVVVQGHNRTTYKTRRDTSHTFHLIMSIITCGIWALFVWLPITIWHKFGPRNKIRQRHH